MQADGHKRHGVTDGWHEKIIARVKT